jgi:L-lactate dehydrogenase (cytochrome)
MIHPPNAIDSLPTDYCLGPIDPATLPEISEDDELSEEDQRRQDARNEMPPAEEMLLLQDFEGWAERVLSSVAWAYYRSAADHEASRLDVFLPFLTLY